MHLVRWPVAPTAAALFGLAVLVPAVSASAAAGGSDPDFFARLHGTTAFSSARGHSDYERTATHRDVEVTVNNLPARLRGRRVTVFISGKKVGTMLVNSVGHASREWQTEHGQFVPFAGTGSLCRVRTASGALIVSGRYVRESDH